MNILKTTLLSILIMGTSSTKAQLSESLGNYKAHTQKGQTVEVETENGRLALTVYSPELIRVRAVKDGFGRDFSYAVVAEVEKAGYTIADKGGYLLLETDSLRLQIGKQPVLLSFYTKDGRLLNEDEEFGINWIGEQVTAYKKLQDAERFIGLGDKKGPMDRRGTAYENWNRDHYEAHDGPGYKSFPFYIGLHGGLCYGIFLDNTHRSRFNFGASNDRFASFSASAGEMDYYFIYGNDVPAVVENYTWLTGRMPMPPLTALGYQQCRWSYFPDTEVVALAETFRRKQIPADMIYLDIHYMDDYKVFTWHPERFPEPKAMMEKLKDMGFSVTVIIDPGVGVEKGYNVYHEALENDLILKYPDGRPYKGEVWPGWSVFPDFTKPEARQWWGTQFEELASQGIDGFWNDMNEIATWGGDLPELIEFDYEGDRTTARKARNIYGMQMARATYEGTKKQLDGRRPFVLTRSAFCGVQRYSALWTGDNAARQDFMAMDILAINNYGLSGVSLAAYDIGGFAWDATDELYARWISIGCFSPITRTHTIVNTHDSEPWSYGERTEDLARRYIELRYQLLPYIYSAFRQSVLTGMPVQRSLAFNYADDDKIFSYPYQYEFGDAFLVCPVDEKTKIGKIYLPKGQWYDFFTDELREGKSEAYVETPLIKLPVFVKAGSIIPMQSLVQSTAQKPDEVLRLHVYYDPDENDHSYLYYEDDGHSFAYEDGQYYERKINYWAHNRGISLDEKKGDYSSQFTKVKIYLHGFPALDSVGLSGKKIALSREDYRPLHSPYHKMFDDHEVFPDRYNVACQMIETALTDEALYMDLFYTNE